MTNDKMTNDKHTPHQRTSRGLFANNKSLIAAMFCANTRSNSRSMGISFLHS